MIPRQRVLATCAPEHPDWVSSCIGASSQSCVRATRELHLGGEQLRIHAEDNCRVSPRRYESQSPASKQAHASVFGIEPSGVGYCGSIEHASANATSSTTRAWLQPFTNMRNIRMSDNDPAMTAPPRHMACTTAYSSDRFAGAIRWKSL